jgi:NDP-sugar pyrophosphorylase family protein
VKLPENRSKDIRMEQTQPPSPHRNAAGTHAVILAAGLGSRLKHNTQATPKCLINVAGQPMLERMIDTLRAFGVPSATIAVGYLDHVIRKFVHDRHAEMPGISITFVNNPLYASTGSVYSLDLALDTVPQEGDVLLIEGDVVLEPALMRQLFDGVRAGHAAATLLAPYEPELSGTFALIQDDKVSAWLHESVRQPDFPLARSFKTVNLTLVRSGAPRQALSAAVKDAISRFGVKAPLEYAMQQLVADGMNISAVTTGGLKWFEVDTPEDLAIADAMFGEQVHA